MHTQREIIDAGLLTAQIVDTDLGVRDTTVIPGLGIRLEELGPHNRMSKCLDDPKSQLTLFLQ